MKVLFYYRYIKNQTSDFNIIFVYYFHYRKKHEELKVHNRYMNERRSALKNMRKKSC